MKANVKSFFINFSVLFISTVACLASAEIIARIFLPEVSDTFIVQLKSTNKRYHHGPTFNHPVPPKPDMSAYRIMFLGDSFTWGIVQPHESFPWRVQEIYQTGDIKSVGKRNVQTFNYSTPSYSPSIYGAILRDYVPEVKPNMVVIAVDDSDPQDDFLYRNMVVKDSTGLPISVYPKLPGVPKSLSGIARKVKLLRLTLWVMHKKKIAMGKAPQDPDEILFGSRQLRLSHYLPIVARKWEPIFENTIELIDAMVNYCRKNNITVILVNYPYAPIVTTEYCKQWRKEFLMNSNRLYVPVFHEYQKKYAESRQIPYYDFTEYLSKLPDLKDFYREEDGHFTVVGNLHFATQLVKFLDPIIEKESR